MPLQVKSRIAGLIDRLEQGDDPTPEEMRRLMRLQALDIARAGEEYVDAWSLEQEQRTEQFRQEMEA